MISWCPEELMLFAPHTELERGDAAMVAYDGTPPVAGEMVGVEVKGLASYGYDNARRGILDEAYLCQIECYLRALDLRWFCCVVMVKETSSLCEVWVARDDNRWQRIQENVLAARAGITPMRPYAMEIACNGARTGACVDGLTPGRGQPHKHCGGTGKEPGGPYVPVYPCGYCPYREPCWSDLGSLELVFRDGKPRWRIETAKRS